MSSFYGGKQGRTYNIVQRYDSVQQMVTQFQKGGAYTDANYGQYVLIDTVLTSGRSSYQNGLIYRRGFNFLEPLNPMPNRTAQKYNPDNIFDKQTYQQDWIDWAKAPGGGAIYVGQICGPEGRTPQLEIQNWNTFLSQSTASGYGGHSTASMGNNPGMYVENGQYKYNDYVDAGYINLIDSHGDIQGGYIAFDIPSPSFNITAQSVDAYGNQTLNVYPIEDSSTASGTYNIGASTYLNSNNEIRWKYDNLIHVEPSSTAHPFFHNFDIAIPNGIHGQNITKLEMVLGSTILANAPNTNAFGEQIEGPSTDSSGDQIENEDEYLTFAIKTFDGDAAGVETAYLGRWPYRVIQSITTDPDTLGVFNIDYSAGLSSTAPFKEINEITLNPDITQDQDIQASYYYGGQQSIQTIGSLNNILDIRRVGDSIIVLYSDPRVRAAIPQANRYYMAWNDLNDPYYTLKPLANNMQSIPVWIQAGLLYTYTQGQYVLITSMSEAQANPQNLYLREDNKGLIWYNFGPLGAQYHVQGSYTFDDIAISASTAGSIAWGLGLEGTQVNRMGWLITIPDVKVVPGEGTTPSSTYQTQRVFAYNYTEATSQGSTVGYHNIYQNPTTEGGTPAGTYSSNWYEVSMLSDAITPPNSHIVVSQDISQDSEGHIYQTRERLREDGIWFVVSEGGCSHG